MTINNVSNTQLSQEEAEEKSRKIVKRLRDERGFLANLSKEDAILIILLLAVGVAKLCHCPCIEKRSCTIHASIPQHGNA
jgi:hypothetical protein